MKIMRSESESTTTEGTVTPRPADTRSQRRASMPPLQTRETLESLNTALGNLQLNFLSLNEEAAKVEHIGPQIADAEDELRQLKKAVRAYDKQQGQLLDSVKKRIREDRKAEVLESLRLDVKQHLQTEVAKQVKEQVDLQLKDHIPITLEQQQRECDEQLKGVKISYENSEARRQNSSIDICSSQDDLLSVVLKSDGKKSEVWPADLVSLFSYDAQTAKKLVGDYNLPVDEVLEVNFNRFMAHIGIKQQLVILS